MKRILIKSALALSLGVAPVAALAQTGEQPGAEAGAAATQKLQSGSAGQSGGAEAGASTTMPGADADTNAQAGAEAAPAGEQNAQGAEPSGSATQQAGEATQPRLEQDAAAGSDDDPAQAQQDGAGEMDSQAQKSDAETPAQDQAQGEDATDPGTTAAIPEVTTEQRTQITEIIRETEVEPAEVDIELSVGVAVPQTVELHPLPPRIVEIVPAYEGYRYFVLADGRIIIVEPDTYEVVYIITA